MLLHRTNLEKFWTDTGVPDNAVKADGVVWITHGQQSICQQWDDFKGSRERVQQELTDTYGSWSIGEPLPTPYKGVEQLKAEGFIGIYSKQRTGEGMSLSQVHTAVETALKEPPPDNVQAKANEILRSM